MTSGQVVRVRREKLAACMTCSLCHKLLNDATTISECLHTFCRKCIYEKITNDEVDSCPVCNIDLGCTPLEKLRADHNLQDLRAKIFPSSRRNATPHEVVLPIPLPARRKERSLSSLVVSTPRVSSQTGLTGRRTKSAGRKALSSRDSTFSTEEPIKKVEDYPDSSSSPETLSKIVQIKRQNHTSTAETSKQHMSNKDAEDNADAWEAKADLWKPLNCLVEAASRTKSSKSSSQGSLGKSGPSHVHDNEAHVPKPKVKERNRKIKVQDDENGSTPALSGSVKSKKSQGVRQKKAAASEGLNIPAQAIVDAGSSKCQRRVGPIWFSLVASDDQKGVAPLPQISSPFIRIMDGNMPVSYIKKYLVKKLDLKSEAEVEITLQGRPLRSELLLHNLVDLWCQKMPKSERIHTTVGSSAKDFVMVLSYARKAHRLHN
ncbi:E3 ubiquitin protein ligase DRIP2-like [Malania oleifera]|uniref:E3 ubiquitin protein ligase DRIP2-like n=1 Tax=Malania oleifera TaxID=397392 RepID=UPI0025ADEF5E|nr:E3 ubiquitin protein ligase DRIP2-like [Malania oleifera]